MALTNTQKAQVRRYLLFPDINRQYDLRLEAAMDALSVEGVVLVADYLVELSEIQLALRTTARVHLKASRVEEITLNKEEVRSLRAEGNRIARDLSISLDIVPNGLPFSPGSASRMTPRG